MLYGGGGRLQQYFAINRSYLAVHSGPKSAAVIIAVVDGDDTLAGFVGWRLGSWFMSLGIAMLPANPVLPDWARAIMLRLKVHESNGQAYEDLSVNRVAQGFSQNTCSWAVKIVNDCGR
jgi:hypothetical protein